jgi:tRNA(Ile)-lysidine synthase
LIGAHRVEQAVRTEIERRGPARVFVGFSGGLDSTAVLLSTCKAVGADGVVALHANHQIQDEADAFETHCVGVCAALGVRLEHARVTIGSGNVEAAARDARYAYFSEFLDAHDVLLLGHHAEDAVETALLRLAQGRGLLTVPPAGRLGEGEFVRPLLGFSKSELRDYVTAQGASWIEDPTNLDTSLDRNFLRHEIIPRLRTRWPTLEQNVARVAEAAAAIGEALRAEMAHKPDVMRLAELPPGSRARIAWLRAFLESRHHYAVTDKAINAFAGNLDIAETCFIEVDDALLGSYEGALVYEPVCPRRLDAAVALERIDQELDLGWAFLKLRPIPSNADAEADDRSAFKWSGRVEVRCRQGGERIRIRADGPTRTVKNLLAEAKVPTWRRDAYPLVFADGELVCLPGIAARAVPGSASSEADYCEAELVIRAEASAGT